MTKLKEFFSKLSKRERLIFYGALLVVFIGALDRLFYRPMVNLFDELDQEIVLQENQLRKNMRYLAAREAIHSRYSAYAAYSVTHGADEEEVASLLNEVEGQARKAGLSLLNIKPKPATSTEFSKQYPVEVEVEAQMKELIKFIDGLQRSKYILRVQKLRLVPKGKSKAEVKGYLLINRTVIR
ncbi:MAG: type 4a pilus biogenesis protein PilO [Candidatus Binatia bacterium]